MATQQAAAKIGGGKTTRADPVKILQTCLTLLKDIYLVATDVITVVEDELVAQKAASKQNATAANGNTNSSKKFGAMLLGITHGLMQKSASVAEVFADLQKTVYPNEKASIQSFATSLAGMPLQNQTSKDILTPTSHTSPLAIQRSSNTVITRPTGLAGHFLPAGTVQMIQTVPFDTLKSKERLHAKDISNADMETTSTSITTYILPSGPPQPPSGKISIRTHWYGYEIFLPRATVLSILSSMHSVESVIGTISILAVGPFAAVQPILGAVGGFLHMEDDQIRQANTSGQGVVLMGLWVMPMILGARTWLIDEPVVGGNLSKSADWPPENNSNALLGKPTFMIPS